MIFTVNGRETFCYTGGKAFDASTPWFTDLLESIGQD